MNLIQLCNLFTSKSCFNQLNSLPSTLISLLSSFTFFFFFSDLFHFWPHGFISLQKHFFVHSNQEFTHDTHGIGGVGWVVIVVAGGEQNKQVLGIGV